MKIPLHSKQYRFFEMNLPVLLPFNPRILLGLHGNNTERFFLKSLYCLECIFSANMATGHTGYQDVVIAMITQPHTRC